MIVAIIGLSGSGKSTLAAHIAEIKQIDLFDMDAEFPEEYRQRHRQGEVVPEPEFTDYQRGMVQNLLAIAETGHVIVAGLFLNDELPKLLEARARILWINLVTDDRSILEQRINTRKGHFAAGLESLDDNWPKRQTLRFGDVFVDCGRSFETVLHDCLRLIPF